ncbi:MAG: hypothetical protein Q4P72_06975 [Eubacteriales bacterium]|nr:hypothetical protein [Eubacteriales bacterium]
MGKIPKEIKKAVGQYFDESIRHVQVFQARPHMIVAVSPAQIVVLDNAEPVLQEPWLACSGAVWDSETETLEISFIEHGRPDTVIKCTNSPSELFLHTMREGMEYTHVLNVEHRSDSGVIVKMGIMRHRDGKLEYWEQITGQVPDHEREEIDNIRVRVKDSVGLEV